MIHFKVLLLVFKSLNGSAPSYLSDLLIDQQAAVVPRTRLKSRCDRAVAVAAPRLWNGLAIKIRSTPTLSIYKSRLKSLYLIWRIIHDLHLCRVPCSFICDLVSVLILLMVIYFVQHMVSDSCV